MWVAGDQDFSSCSTETIITEQDLLQQQKQLKGPQFQNSFQVSVEKDKAVTGLTKKAEEVELSGQILTVRVLKQLLKAAFPGWQACS